MKIGNKYIDSIQGVESMTLYSHPQRNPVLVMRQGGLHLTQSMASSAHARPISLANLADRGSLLVVTNVPEQTQDGTVTVSAMQRSFTSSVLIAQNEHGGQNAPLQIAPRIQTVEFYAPLGSTESEILDRCPKNPMKRLRSGADRSVILEKMKLDQVMQTMRRHNSTQTVIDLMVAIDLLGATPQTLEDHFRLVCVHVANKSQLFQILVECGYKQEWTSGEARVFDANSLFKPPNALFLPKTQVSQLSGITHFYSLHPRAGLAEFMGVPRMPNIVVLGESYSRCSFKLTC